MSSLTTSSHIVKNPGKYPLDWYQATPMPWLELAKNSVKAPPLAQFLDDVDLVNTSRIHNFLKDIGIGQKILSEGLLARKPWRSSTALVTL